MASITQNDLINLAEDFTKWLEDAEEKYDLEKEEIQEIIKQLLL